MKMCDQGCYNLVVAYLRQMAEDYEKGVEKGDLKTLIEIEKSILSDNYYGDIIGLSADAMILQIRYNSYDTSKYRIMRYENTNMPRGIIKKGE